jgi:dolichol-phosphate mannosyltransferase
MKDFIVIPTYNERENIQSIIDAIFKVTPWVYVLVVDDNSPDGTGKMVEKLMQTRPKLSILKREKKEGLGKAYINAFKKILEDDRARTIITMDADFSHDPVYLPVFLEKRNDYDLVSGSRNVSGGGTEGWELWRRLLSRGGNFYARILTGLPIKDCTGGFNAISAEYLRKINLDSIDSSGYAFVIEMKYLLHKAGARIYEHPIIFRNRRGGESKISGHIVGEGVLAPWKIILRKRN